MDYKKYLLSNSVKESDYNLQQIEKIFKDSDIQTRTEIIMKLNQVALEYYDRVNGTDIKEKQDLLKKIAMNYGRESRKLPLMI